MNASVHRTFTVIHTSFAKNVTARNANAKHHINLLEEIAFWPVAKTADNVHLELNAFQLLAVLAIALAPKVIEPKVMVVALM